jgi:hypothetical protein
MDLGKTKVSEECITSIIKVNRISKLGKALVVTINSYVPLKPQFCVTFHYMAFFIVSAMKTSNHTLRVHENMNAYRLTSLPEGKIPLKTLSADY